MSTNPRPEPSISKELSSLSQEAVDALKPMGWTRCGASDLATGS